MPWPIDAGDRKCEQADLDLTLRAIHGIWTSVFIFLVLAVFTSYFQEHPIMTYSFAAAVGLIICLRLGSYRWQNRPGPSRRLWRALYLSTILLMGLCWGTFYAATVLIYGYE